MLRLLKVSGDSLTPYYLEGDFVVVSKIPLYFAALKPGDVVVLRHPIFGILIKFIERVIPERDQIFVVGSNQPSLDSLRFGPVRKSDLIGKVIWHIKKS